MYRRLEESVQSHCLMRKGGPPHPTLQNCAGFGPRAAPAAAASFGPDIIRASSRCARHA
jgi:hypothetical protein